MGGTSEVSFQDGFDEGYRKGQLDIINQGYSPALDEIYRLSVKQVELAGFLVECLALKTFPKSKRADAQEYIDQIRAHSAKYVREGLVRAGWEADVAARRRS